jgi:hypothetical protein
VLVTVALAEAAEAQVELSMVLAVQAVLPLDKLVMVQMVNPEATTTLTVDQLELTQALVVEVTLTAHQMISVLELEQTEL